MRATTIAILAATALAAGCHSYTIVQSNVFVDEDGNVVTVEYGRSESAYTSTFISPVTGKEMEFKSKLMVRAELPDGDTFTAWQCMNFLVRGTMYGTSNGKWKLLADGFSCAIYRQTEDETDYIEVYRGVLCDTPGEIKAKKDDRWKVVPNDPRTYRKPPQAKPSEQNK